MNLNQILQSFKDLEIPSVPDCGMVALAVKLVYPEIQVFGIKKTILKDSWIDHVYMVYDEISFDADGPLDFKRWINKDTSIVPVKVVNADSPIKSKIHWEDQDGTMGPYAYLSARYLGLWGYLEATKF
jgi:hypothetical protein